MLKHAMTYFINASYKVEMTFCLTFYWFWPMTFSVALDTVYIFYIDVNEG